MGSLRQTAPQGLTDLSLGKVAHGVSTEGLDGQLGAPLIPSVPVCPQLTVTGVWRAREDSGWWGSGGRGKRAGSEVRDKRPSWWFSHSLALSVAFKLT